MSVYGNGNCKWCGNSYEINKAGHDYCSDRCRAAKNREQYRRFGKPKRLCKTCGAKLDILPGRGKVRLYCNELCRPVRIPRKGGECHIEGCGRLRRSPRCKYCEMHYYRIRRNGHLGRLLRQPVVDAGRFDVLDDPAAWLMGLIWTDGCLSDSNTLSITSKDLQMIETAEMVLAAKDARYQRKSGAYDIIVTCHQLSNTLRGYGLHERKSLTIRWPVGLPSELDMSFLRGVLDGDGCVSIAMRRSGQQASDCTLIWYTASPGFACDIEDALSRHELRSTKFASIRTNSKHHPLYAVKLHRIEDVRKAFGLMYPQADLPCLLRKKEKLVAWYQTPRGRAGRRKGWNRSEAVSAGDAVGGGSNLCVY